MSQYSLCWINNEIIPAEQAQISVLDHGLLYGDGIFEGLRFYHNRVFRLQEHLERLQQSANAISLHLPCSLLEIEQAVNKLVDTFDSEQGYLRLVVTRGVGSLGIDPQKCPKGQMFIIADQLSVVNHSAPQDGIQLLVASTRRIPMDSLDPKIKSLNYLNNILARIEANKAGADEALMLNQQGFICEGTVNNIFLVKHGVLMTPPISDGILAGITRSVILSIAEQTNIAIQEKSLSVYDALNADECFLSGTGAELIPVKQINNQTLPDTESPLYPMIQQHFRGVIEQECLLDQD